MASRTRRAGPILAVGQHGLEARLGELGERRGGVGVRAASIFGVKTTSGLRQLRSACRRSRWKYCAGGRRLADLQVVLGRELQEALDARARVLGPLPLVAVRQQQHEPGEQPPLVLAGGEELVDDDLRAVGEVAELRLPEDERLRVVAQKPYSKPSAAASESIES